MLTALLTIWICVFGVWYWLERRRFLNFASKIPGPPGYPIIGNALTLWGKPEDVLRKLHEMFLKYPRMAGFWIGPKLHVALFEPKDVEIVLRSKATEKAYEYQYIKPWLGDSLLISSGAKFRQHKKIIMPSFHMNNLRRFLPIFNDHANCLVKKLQAEIKDEEFNIQPYFTKTTMDALLETVLGITKETLGKEVADYATAIERLGRLIIQRVYKFWLRPEIIFRFSNLRKEIYKYIAIVHGLTERVIKQRKNKIECQANSDFDDNPKEDQWKVFLDDLLQARDENGFRMTDEDIKAEVATMMFAGQDTTSSTLGFALSLLGLYQKVQDKLIMEVDEIFGDSHRPTTYEDIQNLRYMEQVIQETWRLYPPIPLVAKKPLEDINLGDCVIPANSTIGIMIMALHRNPNHFSRPDRFNPDNFLPENIKARHQYSYMPFSAGPRTCVGPKYAMLLVKVILATLFRSFRVYSNRPEHTFVLSGQTVLKRREGFPISLKPREKETRVTAAA